MCIRDRSFYWLLPGLDSYPISSGPSSSLYYLGHSKILDWLIDWLIDSTLYVTLHRSRASLLVCYTMLLACSASFVRTRISLTIFTVTIRRSGLLTCNKRAWHEMHFHFIYCRRKPYFKVQMRKNPFSAGVPPRTLLGELTTLTQTP